MTANPHLLPPIPPTSNPPSPTSNPPFRSFDAFVEQIRTTSRQAIIPPYDPATTLVFWTTAPDVPDLRERVEVVLRAILPGDDIGEVVGVSYAKLREALELTEEDAQKVESMPFIPGGGVSTGSTGSFRSVSAPSTPATGSTAAAGDASTTITPSDTPVFPDGVVTFVSFTRSSWPQLLLSTLVDSTTGGAAHLHDAWVSAWFSLARMAEYEVVAAMQVPLSCAWPYPHDSPRHRCLPVACVRTILGLSAPPYPSAHATSGTPPLYHLMDPTAAAIALQITHRLIAYTLFRTRLDLVRLQPGQSFVPPMDERLMSGVIDVRIGVVAWLGRDVVRRALALRRQLRGRGRQVNVPVGTVAAFQLPWKAPTQVPNLLVNDWVRRSTTSLPGPTMQEVESTVISPLSFPLAKLYIKIDKVYDSVALDLGRATRASIAHRGTGTVHGQLPRRH